MVADFAGDCFEEAEVFLAEFAFFEELAFLAEGLFAEAFAAVACFSEAFLVALVFSAEAFLAAASFSVVSLVAFFFEDVLFEEFVFLAAAFLTEAFSVEAFLAEACFAAASLAAPFFEDAFFDKVFFEEFAFLAADVCGDECFSSLLLFSDFSLAEPLFVGDSAELVLLEELDASALFDSTTCPPAAGDFDRFEVLLPADLRVAADRSDFAEPLRAFFGRLFDFDFVAVVLFFAMVFS